MNQSIKAKLVGGFAVILLLFIVAAFFMTSKLSETNDSLGSIVDVSSKKVRLSQQILIDVLNATRYEKNLMLSHDLTKKNSYLTKMNEALSTLDKKVQELNELVTEKGAADLKEFSTVLSDYKISQDEIVQLAMKNENDKAFEISNTKGLKTREDVIAIMERIVNRNEMEMVEDKRISNESYKSSLWIIITLLIAIFILSIVIALWIIQSITKRISVIAKEAEKIASREFTNDKLEDTTNDEFKTIFNSLVSVNESFREVTEKANNVASGNYAVDMIHRSDKDTLGNSLKKMTRSLRETTAANEKHNWLT